jgi:tryptophanyl-tRNA synthetase
MAFSGSKKVIVSGMRPTGLLHLGHYFGVLKNWLELQSQHQCYFFAADWHCLTTEYAAVEAIQKYVTEMALDWLAAGIDPAKAVVFVQSKIPEHAELHLLFSMITPISWLERVPSYKDLQQELTGKDLSTYGFLGYPLLQTADVAIYKANAVPVGQDQVAHIELSREVVRRFNHLYKKEVFPEPEALLTKASKIVGVDGRKMSKSYNNAIYLSDTEEQANKKLMQHMTDPARKRREDPGNPDICPIYGYHQIVSETPIVEQVNQDCRTAKIGCVDCKKLLIQGMTRELAPFRQRRADLAKNKDELQGILSHGAKQARTVAAQTLNEANQAIGLSTT